MLKIGTAAAVITPPEGIHLCGYPNPQERANTGVLVDLKTKALALDDGKEKAVIITNDLIGLRLDLVTRIREAVSAAAGLEPGKIMVSCSHTHSGPNVAFGGEYAAGQEYIDLLVKTIADTVKNAGTEMIPVTVGTGTGSADLCHNRRVLDKNGKSTSGWQDPDRTHTGVTDQNVYVMAFKDESGKTAAVLTGYACHPVVMGPPNAKVSADYPGYLQAALEDKLGCQAMFFNAAGGNINPYLCIENDDGEAKRMGEALADETLSVLDTVTTSDVGGISSETDHIVLAPNPNPSEKLKKRLKNGLSEFKTEVQRLRIGDILIVTAPGELLVEVAQRIRKKGDGKPTLVFAYTNDYLGYLPPPEICNQGGYEVDSAPTHEFQEKVLALL